MTRPLRDLSRGPGPGPPGWGGGGLEGIYPAQVTAPNVAGEWAVRGQMEWSWRAIGGWGRG